MTGADLLNSGPVWGAAGVLFTGLFAWFTQRSKGRVDESVSVRQQWEKLTGGLQDRLAAVEKEFSEYRIEMARKIGEIEQRHAHELAEQRQIHEAQMRAMRELNDGLQRQIIQLNRSAPVALGEVLANEQVKRREEGRKRRRNLGEDDE